LNNKSWLKSQLEQTLLQIEKAKGFLNQKEEEFVSLKYKIDKQKEK